MNKLFKQGEWLGPVLLLVVLTAVALGTRPMTPIDETRYVSVAWEMWLRDEYLVLYKNGEPYSHKPPMLFWLYNLGWMAFGVNEWWPRMVSPLFSLGGLLLTLSIARRLWPTELEAGRNALWVLSSSLLWMVFSTSAMFDVMLAFFVLLGMRGLLIAAAESRLRGFIWLAVAIGLGVLAKGPVILLHLLPAAVLAPWWTKGMHGTLSSWKNWYGSILLAIVGGAAIALAWAIPAAIHGGEEYRNAIFWGQTANRMVDSFAHKRPIWWYLPLLPILLFPWLVWPALWKRFAALRETGLDMGLRFCLAWMLPVFAAFSFISGKQIHYLVPLFPSFALVAGYLLVHATRTKLEQPAKLFLPTVLMLVAGSAMVYFAFVGLPGDAAIWKNFSGWPGALLVLLAILLAWMGRIWKRAIPALAILSAAFLSLFQLYLSPAAYSSYDVHPIANEINKLQQRGVTVAHAGNYHAQYQFAGRLLKPLEMLEAKEVKQWLETHPDGAVVAYTSRENEPADFLFSQPYRGETAVLMSVAQIKALGGLPSKKGGKIKLEGEG